MNFKAAKKRWLSAAAWVATVTLFAGIPHLADASWLPSGRWSQSEWERLAPLMADRHLSGGNFPQEKFPVDRDDDRPSLPANWGVVQPRHMEPVLIHVRHDTVLPGGDIRVEYRWILVDPNR